MATGDNQHAAEAEGLWAAWLVNHHYAGEAYEHAQFAYSLLEAEPDSAEKAYVVGALGRIASNRGNPGRPYLVDFLRMARCSVRGIWKPERYACWAKTNSRMTTIWAWRESSEALKSRNRFDRMMRCYAR